MRDVRGVVAHPGGTVRLEALSLDDELGPHDVHVRPLASGACMCDLEPTVPAAAIEHPVLLGHELVGEVLAIGESVTRCRPGDVVVAARAPVCGSCRYCRRGLGNLCTGVVAPLTDRSGRFRVAAGAGSRVGQYRNLGALADEIVTDDRQLMAIDHGYARLPAVALLSCSLSTAAGATYQAQQFLTRERIAIVGAGGLGGCVLLVLHSLGISDVTVIDPDPVRLDRARALRASAVRLPSAADDGTRYGVVFEASLGGAGLPLAFELTDRGGHCIAMGTPRENSSTRLNHPGLVADQRTLVGTVGASATPWDVYIRALSAHAIGDLPFEQVVEREYHGLGQALEALDDARSHRVGKALIVHSDLAEVPAR
jgi:threonine dehydrogenase-like Zn-dependent dehydrogenase